MGFANALTWAFSWGYLSHLLVDVPSGGVRLLAPFIRIRFGGTLLRTGGVLELVLRYGVIAGIIFLQIKPHFPGLTVPAVFALAVIGVRAIRRIPKLV